MAPGKSPPLYVVAGNEASANTTTSTVVSAATAATSFNAFRLDQSDLKIQFADARGWHGDVAPPEQGPDMSGSLTPGEVDAKIAASEARSETKIVRLEGKMDLVLSRLDSIVATIDRSEKAIEKSNGALKEDNKATRTTVWQAVAIGVAVIALVVGVGQWAFGFGAQVRDMARAEAQIAAPPDVAPSEKAK